MTRGAAYARYSSENQRDESIDAQICAIQEYANRNDIQIVATYIDRAKSATTADRPSFQEMIKMSETGLFDAIIVHKLDRFARSKYDSAVYKQKLKVNNVRLLSVTENLDGTPESIILESVLEAMAEYYSKNLAREIMKGTMENAKKAVHCGGIPPLGYDIIDKKLVINENEAKAVQIIFEMYADGKGYTDIINVLNNNNFRTKRGNKFGKNSLFEILRNEKYKGTFVYNKSSGKTVKGTYNRHSYKDSKDVIKVENGCPRIVSDELFTKVAERQKQNKAQTSKNRARQKYLLSGLVYCGYCGSPMHANRRKKDSQLTFRCNRKVQSISCKAKEINMAYLENYVLTELKNNVFSYNKVSSIMKMIDKYTDTKKTTTENQAEPLKIELSEINKSRNNIIHAIEQGMTESYFAQRLSELQQKEENIKAQLLIIDQPESFKVTRKDIMLLINRFNYLRKSGDLEGLRKIVLRFVDRIVVTDEKVNVFLKLSFGDVEIKSNEITAIRKRQTVVKNAPMIKNP